MEYTNNMDIKESNHNEVTMEEREKNFLTQIDYIKKKGLNIQLNEILEHFCYNENDVMLLNFYCMKWLGKIDKQIIINVIRNNMQSILNKGYKKVMIHVCLKSLSVSQMDIFYSFFKEASTIFKQEFPDRLEKCYLYHCSSVFSSLYKMISHFLEKETLQRIEVYKGRD
jgi:hypothetical protein